MLAAKGGAVVDDPPGRIRARSTRQRARVNVTRAIHRALAQIAEALPDLGRHFDASVRTGSSCMYRPDPRAAIAWQVHVD